MADINNELNQTEQNLKNVEQQAGKTEQAIRGLTNAENDALSMYSNMHKELYNKAVGMANQFRSKKTNSVKIDGGISAPEGAFSQSISDLGKNVEIQAEKEHQEQVKNTAKTYEELRTRVSEATNSIRHAIANVIGVIRTANNILHKIGITIVSVFNGAIRTVQRIIQLFGNLGNRIGLTNKQTNILKGSFTELKSAIDLLSGAFNKIFNNQFIEQGRKLLGSIQSLKMMLGTDLTNSTIEWANKMEDAFGLSAEELISNLKEVAAVMYGLGMSTKDVQVGARNLETVGMVLSSISGYDFDTTMNKLQSGIKGMTRSIDDLGISLRNTTIEDYLKKLKAQGGEFANIATSTKQLTDQQLVYVRYAALMDQFTSKEAYTMEKYAESLRSTTGSLSVLNSQLNGLKSAIGTLAMGLFSKVLQPLIYVVYYIKQLIIQLGSFLGIKMKLDAEMNGGGEINTTPIENETDALDEMTDAANKAKGALDELDHISTMSSSSGKSSNNGNSDFDYSSLMNNYDFADALAEYDANFIEECRQSFHNMLSDIGNDIEKFIKKYSGRIIDWDEVKKNLSVVKESLGGVFTNLVSIAKTAFGTIAGLAYSVFDDLEFTSLTAKFSEALLSFTTFIDTAFKRIQPYVQLFYDRYLSEHVKKFGKYLSDTLDNIKAKFDGLTEEWNNMDDSTLVKKTDELGEKFNNMLTTLKEIGIIFKTLAGLDTDADNQFMNENASDNMKKAQGIAKTTNSILKETLDIIYQVLHGLADLNDDGVVDSKDLGVAFDFIKEKLDMISTWLKENKDTIVKLLENAAETAFKLAETKFDLIMGILNWITDNADLVNGFLDAIKEILELVKEHPMLTLGLIVGGSLSGKGLFGGGAGAAGAAAGAAGAAAGAAGAAAGGKGGIRDTIYSALAMYFGGVAGKNVGKYVYEETAGKDMGAQKGKSLGIAAAAWLTKHPVIAWLELMNAEVADLWGQAKKLPGAVKESKDYFASWKRGDFGKVYSEDGIAKGYKNISKGQIEQWAYEVRKAAEQVYGKDVSAEQSEKVLAIFRNRIAAQGKITKEQLDNLMSELRTYYDKIGKIDYFDKFEYEPFTFSGADKMKENVDSISQMIEKVDELGSSIEDVNAATDELFNQKYNFSDYIKNFFGKTDELFDAPTTFTDRIISNFKLMTETIKTSCEATKLDLGGLIDKFKNIGNNNNPINNMFNENTDINTLSKQADIIKAKFENMGTTIKSSCDTAKSGISGLIDKLKELLNSTDFGKTANSIINLGSSLMTGKKTKEVKKLLGFANGGLPSSGSLFMANENGNTELVGNFGGYAGVANQGMIISAMENAVYNAVTQALKTNTGNGGNTTIEVCKGGVFVGDEAGIRKLANQLNNVNSTGRTNIANVGFSMT